MISNSSPRSEGIATDGAHSSKNGCTQYRGIDLRTGLEIFRENLGNKTVNVGEFLGIVAAIKYILEHDYKPRVIYTDSQTAIAWIKYKKTNSKKKNVDLLRAGIFLRAFASEISDIKIIHWNTKEWGEIPADFGNK